MENGGGAAIWIKKAMFSRVTMPQIKKEWEEDQVWVAIETAKKQIAVGTIYLRPEGPYCRKEEVAEKIQVLMVRILELQELRILHNHNGRF